jgi:outer membrane protein assembly factor BamB
MIPHRLLPASALALALLALSADLRGADSSSQEPPLDDVLRGAPCSVCVLVAPGDGTLAVRLAEGGRRLVHVLEPDDAALTAERSLIGSRGLQGLAAAEPWSSASLPYPENLVNLIISYRDLPDAELARVVAPGGTAMVRRAGAWSSVRKERPANFDDWTHWRHGADGNMVSGDRAVDVPTGLRWVAGPAQDAGGRKWYYDHVLVTANGRNFYDYDDLILARDAYNGVVLWSRAFKAPSFKESGLPLPPNPTPKMKLGGRTSKVRPVAAGDRLYAVGDGKLLVLDAATGKTLAELADTRDPRELLVDGGLLMLSDASEVRAFDTSTLKPVWEQSIDARRMVSEGDGLFVVTAGQVVGLDRATGKVRWKTDDTDAELALTCTAHAGYLVLEKSSLRDDPIGCGIKVYSTKTGELLWTKDYKPDMTHFREARAYFAQGLLWIPAEKEGLLGLEPKNGSERKQWMTRGKHCATPVATERFFLAPECEFTDLADGTQTRSRMFKSACRQPFVPANGLLYTFPVQCECFPMLRGTMGLSSEKPAGLAEGPRLEKSGALPAAPALLRPEEADLEWPVYRHDAWRSGRTPAPLRRADPRRSWETAVASSPDGTLADEWKTNPFVKGVLSAPVAAGGSVFVSVPDQHRVVALEAKTGRQLWSFTAGGRLDGPPTIVQDLCLFGAHDGWVYALNAVDGRPVWRLRAAPRESRILAYGQMESPWPVVSSVLVDRDLAYVAAGRHPTSDGGVRVLAFRPRTGEIVWEKSIDNLDAITRWYGGTLPGSKTKVGVDFEPVDMLVRDGDAVSMSRWRFDPKTGDTTLALDSVTYSAPGGVAVPRGFWGYGIRQTKMVQPRPPAVFDGRKIQAGVTGDAAMILSGGTLVTVTGKGDLRVGEKLVILGVEPVVDGLISAYGALYLSTQKGTIVCVE